MIATTACNKKQPISVPDAPQKPPTPPSFEGYSPIEQREIWGRWKDAELPAPDDHFDPSTSRVLEHPYKIGQNGIVGGDHPSFTRAQMM